MLRSIRVAIGGALLASLATPVSAEDWTPHTAAALLDASFPNAQACRRALDDARRRERAIGGGSIHGLSYAHLFEQGRCASLREGDGMAWRIRMHWKHRG